MPAVCSVWGRPDTQPIYYRAGSAACYDSKRCPGVPALPFDESSGFTTPPAFGGYRVLHQLGSGVLGPVFRAYDAPADRIVAIKAFRLDLIPEDVARLADALRAVVAAGALHPNVTAARGAGIEGATAYLASDFVPGQTLDVAMRGLVPASPGVALPLIRQVAAALDAAWAAGFGHGALHPRDIFLMPGREDVRVTGVGLSTALETVGVKAPVRRPYTAPERVAGGTWDIRADVFALGAIAHELLTGRRPVGPGEQDGRFAADVSPDHRARLRSVLASALAADPDARFTSATELAGALEQASHAGQLDLPIPTAAGMTGESGPAAGDLAAPQLPDVPQEVEHDRSPVAAVPPVVEADDPDRPGDPGEADERREAAGGSGEVREASRASAVVAVVPPLASRRVRPSADPAHLDLAATDHAGGSRWRRVAAVAVIGVGLGVSGAWFLLSRADRGGPPMTEVEVTTADDPAAAAPSDTEVDVSSPEAIAGSAPAPRQPAPPDPPARRVASPTGRLLVRSTPAGALVTIDGTLRGETPATIRDLSLGTYRVQVAYPGHTPATRDVTLSASSPAVSMAIALQPALDTTVSRRGIVVVDSRPRGARVSIDGRLVGTTPFTLSAVSAGRHTVRLELEGYRPVTAPVTVTGGQESRVAVTLEPTRRPGGGR